jgi:CheY-like chemotaxis protein
VMLDALVRDTVDEMEGQARGRDVALRAELPDRVAPIDADEARMRQVLVNLIGNALKFTERGEVVVRLLVDGTGHPTLLEVRDTGIGIPADRLDAIFNVFEQAESMINRRFGGTGLGLAISRSLCELMGHRLEVSSVEGEGTTMSVVIGQGVRAARMRTPRGIPVIAPAGSRSAAPDAGGRTVLIVDDDADARALLAELLEEAGCRLVIASTGVEALRLAREVRPAMIFLDLRLPRISGFDVLRILQADEELRTTPVVVASVVGTESRNALVGAAAILDKPLDRVAVFDVLRQLLAAAPR